jgi:hypothetical protein
VHRSDPGLLTLEPNPYPHAEVDSAVARLRAWVEVGGGTQERLEFLDLRGHAGELGNHAFIAIGLAQQCAKLRESERPKFVQPLLEFPSPARGQPGRIRPTRLRPTPGGVAGLAMVRTRRAVLTLLGRHRSSKQIQISPVLR